MPAHCAPDTHRHPTVQITATPFLPAPYIHTHALHTYPYPTCIPAPYIHTHTLHTYPHPTYQHPTHAQQQTRTFRRTRTPHTYQHRVYMLTPCIYTHTLRTDIPTPCIHTHTPHTNTPTHQHTPTTHTRTTADENVLVFKTNFVPPISEADVPATLPRGDDGPQFGLGASQDFGAVGAVVEGNSFVLPEPSISEHR